MKFLKKIFVFTAAASLCSGLWAASVNENELKSAGNPDTIVFENYTGPHSVINSVSEIQEIGSEIGKQVSANVDVSKSYGSSAKYSVIHCIDPNESGKLDADIFIIGSSATVDHIKNLRRIIASYLSAAYGYSSKDAETVAVFVTVYNAVYRSNMTYFSSKYKKVVTDNLTSAKCGLAISYKDWPGSSQIVIPLNDVRGGLSTVDTSVISDKKVVSSMQEDDDRNIDSRKQMVDIKEREADNAQEKATEAQKKATEEKNNAKEEVKKAEEMKKEAEDAKKEAEVKKAEAEEARKTADENPKDKEAQKEAEVKEEEAKEAEAKAEEAVQNAEKQEEKAEEAKEAAAQAEKEAEEAQETADIKRTEAQTERTTIAKDQLEVIETEKKNESSPAAYGLKLIDDLGVLSGLVKINANDGSIIKESPVTVIRNRTILESGDNFIAVAGVPVGNGAVKLVQISKDTMEIVKESEEILSENSVLVENGGSYYCVIKEGKSDYFVAKYSADLQLLLKSQISVKPATSIFVSSNGIMVTDTKGKPALLKVQDLSPVAD